MAVLPPYKKILAYSANRRIGIQYQGQADERHAYGKSSDSEKALHTSSKATSGDKVNAAKYCQGQNTENRNYPGQVKQRTAERQ